MTATSTLKTTGSATYINGLGSQDAVSVSFFIRRLKVEKEDEATGRRRGSETKGWMSPFQSLFFN